MPSVVLGGLPIDHSEKDLWMLYGTGSPVGLATANRGRGSLFLQTDGPSGVVLWNKTGPAAIDWDAPGGGSSAGPIISQAMYGMRQLPSPTSAIDEGALLSAARLFTAPQQWAARDTVPRPAYGRTVATLQDWVDHAPRFRAADFGVIGDGVADDTAAAQVALTAGATYGRVVDFGSMVVKLTGGLSCTGPGIVFDTCSYGNTGDMGFYVTGSGYTALTIAGSGTRFQLCVYGTGNTANGIYCNNPLLAQMQKLRVYNLVGVGMRVDKCWDCTFHDISIELCNPTGATGADYSFTMQPAGDTCNMTHIGRLQVERCGLNNGRVIYVDGSTLSCIIDNIHSEQATSIAGVNTWYLGSSRTLYNSGRFTALVPANATLKLAAGNATYVNFLVEGAITVEVDAGSVNSTANLITFEVQGTLKVTTNQVGTMIVIGGTVASFATDPTYIRVFGTKIATLTIGYSAPTADPWRARFYNCDIGVLVSSSTNSAAMFNGCQIAEGGNLLRGSTLLYGCSVTTAGSIAHSSGILEAHGTVFNTSITWTNAATIRLHDSRITGSLTKGDAGNTDVLIDDATWVQGAVTWNVAPSAGAHYAGQHHKNLISTVGNPKGWYCTVAGTPGTWVSEGNL